VCVRVVFTHRTGDTRVSEGACKPDDAFGWNVVRGRHAKTDSVSASDTADASDMPLLTSAAADKGDAKSSERPLQAACCPVRYRSHLGVVW
jgi:hypothetical protein